MLTMVQEKRLREGVRYLREHGATHDYAFWIGGGMLDLCYLVGKRKIKVYFAGMSNGPRPSGTSKKSTGILIGETSADGPEAYAELAEKIEAAMGEDKETGYTNPIWGYKYRWIAPIT